MSISLNGWPGISSSNSSLLATGVVPGTQKKVTLQRDVLPLFLAFLSDWHRTVHTIEYAGALGPDGWEYREARTGAGLSNHASGTAVDVTYDWLKADHARHMSTAEIAAVHHLLDKYKTSAGKRVFGWGGDWQVGKFCDEMHTELIQSWSPGSLGSNASLSDVRNVILRLGIQPDGTFNTAAPKPPAFPGSFTTGAKGPHVKAIQIGLRITADGDFGPQTFAAVSAYQRKHPLLLLVPITRAGVVNRRTYAVLARPIV